MSGQEDWVRNLAAQVGSAIGQEELVQDLLSGRMEADVAAPLLAGCIDGSIRQVFGPIVGIREYIDFVPETRPLIAQITLLDGSRLRVVVEPLNS